MKPGWVAGSVRARGLASRALGGAGSRAVATAGSLPDALAVVAASSYGRGVTPGMDLATAQQGVWATTLWHLRVLAGWLVAGGSDLVRLLAGGFEIANIELHLDALNGGAPNRPFDLGSLATAWPRIRSSRSRAELRQVLAASPWGDPETTEPAALAATLRLAWARRVTEVVPALRRCAVAAGALLVARERFAKQRTLNSIETRDARRLLGSRWERADDITTFAAALTPDARWVFADITDADALWLSEARWWASTGAAAARGVRGDGPGEAVVTAAAVVLLTDAHLVCSGLEAAVWGRSGRDEFDALV